MTTQSINLVKISGLTIVGLAVGWFLRGKPVYMDSQVTASSSLPSPGQITKSQKAIKKPETKWERLAKNFSATSSEDRKVSEENIAPQDRKGAIEALLSQGGPSGFPDGMKEVIERLLTLWGGENFTEAWAWGQQLQGEGFRSFVACRLLNVLVETDPEQALALHLELVQKDSNFESDVPEKVLVKAALTNAEDFIKYIKKFGPSHSFGTGEFCEFKDKFNFQQVADELTKSKKDKYTFLPRGFPMNFFDEWAKRDCQAAFDGSVLVGLLDFDKFLIGLEQDKAEASWTWVAEQIQKSEISSKVISEKMDIPSESFNGIIQALPDAATRDRFLMQLLLDESNNHTHRDISSLAISSMSSPQMRLEALTQMPLDKDEKTWRGLNAKQITEGDLQAWGITREQISAILEKPANSKRLTK